MCKYVQMLVFFLGKIKLVFFWLAQNEIGMKLASNITNKEKGLKNLCESLFLFYSNYCVYLLM